MGLFNNLKNKAKEITQSIEDATHQEEVVQEESSRETEQAQEEIEREYQPSEKEVAGVPYPNGWESLSEAEILNKLDEFFKAYDDANDDDEKEDRIVAQYGFKDVGHYELFKNALWQERAASEGISATQAIVDQMTDQRKAKVNEAVASDREDLQPVDGVSLELWAKAVAYSANSGGDTAGAAEIMGKDQAGFDKVCEEWNTRMANDTTYTIMQIYGAAFTATATEDKPEITTTSFPYKKYIKVGKAMELLTEQGRDAQEVLGMFDMTAVDWSNVSAFWPKEYHSDVEKYMPLYEKYSKKYEKKYKASDSNTDIEF